MAPVLQAITEGITAAAYICIVMHTERQEEELGAQKKVEQNVLIYPIWFCNESVLCFAVTETMDQRTQGNR